MKIKRMGVMNITPNSFSDGGEVLSPESFQRKLNQMGEIEALDIGAESTAPMNSPITWKEEWERLESFIPFILKSSSLISIDTYHPETIDQILKIRKDHKIERPLIWNDVSGKFDHFAKAFLKLDSSFQYVFCHNLAPIRECSGKHMEHMWDLEGDAFLDELASYLRQGIHPQVILDPCLGFSKTYDQNWFILDNFASLQKKTGHDKWLLGFSRKSFLRKKLGIEMDKVKLDQFHVDILSQMKFTGEVWIRTHRPELI